MARRHHRHQRLARLEDGDQLGIGRRIEGESDVGAALTHRLHHVVRAVNRDLKGDARMALAERSDGAR
jgi:hypothetical protein